MKNIKKYALVLATFIALLGVSSCQTEAEMENYLLKGYAWEGRLPIYSYDEYYSRFYFEIDNSGGEEVFVNGLFDKTYNFRWNWLGSDYGVLRLEYRSRWGEMVSCIDVAEINDNRLIGYFYDNINDYYRDRDNGFRDDREKRFFKLQTTRRTR